MSKVLKFDIKLQRKNFLLNAKAEIDDGITGVYGHSGHGKTSLLNAIAGLIQPDSGFIEINDTTVFDSIRKINVPVKNRKIGYVFQDIRLFPHLSVKQNLEYGLKKYTKYSVHFEEVIGILKIESLLDKKPVHCSGGEKQRIAMGRALLSGAKILIMDEPFSAVDVNLRNSIIPFLNEINRRFKIPMLIVSHHLPDLLSLTDSFLLLNNGAVKALGKFHKLMSDESNLEKIKGAGLYNVFNLNVFAVLPVRNIILLKSTANNFQIQALHQSFQRSVEIGMETKVLIRPEDISIALQPVSQISLRNQVKGVIEKIFSKDGLSFCIVDAGERIWIEITEASMKNMNLKEGKTVFCLFKSVALNIF